MSNKKTQKSEAEIKELTQQKEELVKIKNNLEQWKIDMGARTPERNQKIAKLKRINSAIEKILQARNVKSGSKDLGSVLKRMRQQQEAPATGSGDLRATVAQAHLQAFLHPQSSDTMKSTIVESPSSSPPSTGEGASSRIAAFLRKGSAEPSSTGTAGDSTIKHN